MKKGVVIILAVAIIGALGIYGKSHGDSGGGSVFTPSGSNNGSAVTLGSNTSGTSSASYKDGTYTGQTEDTAYGNVQIAVVVSGGRITDVNFLRLPNDLGHSQEVSSFSAPLLKQETIQKQTAHIDFVSGATQTSEGYQQSLQSALDQAAIS